MPDGASRAAKNIIYSKGKSQSNMGSVSSAIKGIGSSLKNEAKREINTVSSAIGGSIYKMFPGHKNTLDKVADWGSKERPTFAEQIVGHDMPSLHTKEYNEARKKK